MSGKLRGPDYADIVGEELVTTNSDLIKLVQLSDN
jgi:hypothetical protein